MSYTEALERLKKLSDTPDEAVPKVPEPPFGTSGTPPPGISEKFNASGTDCSFGNKALSEPLLSKSEKSRMARAGSATSDKSIVSLVQCRDCVNFQPDHINPPAGIGHCRLNADGDRPPWPNAPRRCDQFEITRSGVFRHARVVCKGTDTDPSELTQWLIAQADPDWLTPAAIKRWSGIIQKRGFPHDK